MMNNLHLLPTLSSSSYSFPVITCLFGPQIKNYTLHHPKWRSKQLQLKPCSATTKLRLRASLQDVGNETSATPLLPQNQPNQEVEESVKVLKNAAKTRKVDKTQVLSALSLIEKAKLDPSKFLETLGGTISPGRTWMLIFSAEKSMKDGKYFPITAVHRFDAETGKEDRKWCVSRAAREFEF